MNKYEYAKKELKEFVYGDISAWQYIKDCQKEIADYIINELIPDGNNTISIPYPKDGYWYFPMPKNRESKRGYRSRLMAWCHLYIAENLTYRLDNDERDICGLITQDEIPWFCLEGFKH